MLHLHFNLIDFTSFQSSQNSPAPETPNHEDRQREMRSAMTSPVGDFEPFEDEAEILGENSVVEEDDGEELFGENMERDYLPNPALDRYDEENLDDEGDYSDISQADRRAAEIEMAKRDRAAGLHRDDRDLIYDEGNVTLNTLNLKL